MADDEVEDLVSDRPPTMDPSLLEPIKRMERDIRNASRTLSVAEVRFLVDAYYTMQHDRIRSAHQERMLTAGAEPHDVISWLKVQQSTLEKQVQGALDAYSGSRVPGIWARSIVGIGPVITAGLLAHIDVKQAPTVGHIWAFAGLDPTAEWKEGEVRPWNAALKRLCWLIGESFTKVSSNERDVYGQIYKQRKLIEVERNEAGKFADQAAHSLAVKRFGKETDARKHYEAGRLPPARIHLRAQRYAVKLFLAHFHTVLHWTELGTLPPMPYIFNRPEHTHYLGPPNAAMVSGLAQALRVQSRRKRA